MRRMRLRVTALALVLAMAACGGVQRTDDAQTSTTASTTVADDLTGHVTVLAASSLTAAFTELGGAFEKLHEGARVTFSFAASSALAEQVVQGAPADALATADMKTMARVVEAGKAGAPTVIARNRLAIAVEPGNPRAVHGLADLSRVDFVLCSPSVPCGSLGQAALDKAGVRATPRSLEENVKAVVAKVGLGEVDAGIVYLTDVRASDGKVDGVDIDIASDPALEAIYPMAVTTGSTEGRTAKAFVDFVLGDAGRAVLARHGFLAP